MRHNRYAHAHQLQLMDEMFFAIRVLFTWVSDQLCAERIPVDKILQLVETEDRLGGGRFDKRTTKDAKRMAPRKHRSSMKAQTIHQRNRCTDTMRPRRHSPILCHSGTPSITPATITPQSAASSISPTPAAPSSPAKTP